MEFLSSLFLAIAAFFGFGNPEVVIDVENSPAIVEERITQSEIKSDLPKSDNVNKAVDQNQLTNNKVYMWTNYQKPDEKEIKEKLDDMAFNVTQKEGTERPGTSPLDKNYEPGIYVDILSGEPLFSSNDKYDSGSGWPSFTKPIKADAVTEHQDGKLLMTRTEIRSGIADNHLGHVFTDGPKDSTGLRYCMNGAAMKFIPMADMEASGYGDFLPYIN